MSLSTPAAVTSAPAPGPVMTRGLVLYRAVVKMSWLSVPLRLASGLDAGTARKPTAIFVGVTDAIGERVRKNDAPTLTSIGSIAAATNIADQDKTSLDADKMVKELRDDNAKLLERLREVKQTSEEAGDHATNGVVDDWIDQAEERVWFLSEILK